MARKRTLRPVPKADQSTVTPPSGEDLAHYARRAAYGIRAMQRELVGTSGDPGVVQDGIQSTQSTNDHMSTAVHFWCDALEPIQVELETEAEKFEKEADAFEAASGRA